MNNYFKRRRFPKDVIILAVRWYLRYALSYRNLQEMLIERGIRVDHSNIFRWVQYYAPILEEECRKHMKKTGGSYRIDETYIKVAGKWKYLYRAVDKNQATIDFYFSARRDKGAAKKFFKKMLKQPHAKKPYVINVDKNAAYPKAFSDLKNSKDLDQNCKFRQVKYINNGIESDHRFVKRQVRHKQWFRKFKTAAKTIAGYEIMHMIKKGQIKYVKKGDVIAQKKFIESVFGIAA